MERDSGLGGSGGSSTSGYITGIAGGSPWLPGVRSRLPKFPRPLQYGLLSFRKWGMWAFMLVRGDRAQAFDLLVRMPPFLAGKSRCPCNDTAEVPVSSLCVGSLIVLHDNPCVRMGRITSLTRALITCCMLFSLTQKP